MILIQQTNSYYFRYCNFGSVTHSSKWCNLCSSQIEGNFLEVNGDNVFSVHNKLTLVLWWYVDISSQTNFVGDTEQVDLILTDDTLTVNLKGGVISGSAQLLNVTDFGSGRVSGDNFGDVDGGSTFTGSFEGDGSGLTGFTNLSISGSSGNDMLIY